MSSAWSRPLAWLASALVAVAVLLAPRAAAASAAFCDARATSAAPDVVAMCVALAQAGVEIPDDVAGLCDPSGASAVAPPPSLPVESGTIGAADDCDGPAARGAAISSSQEHKTSRDAAGHSDCATLGVAASTRGPSAVTLHPLARDDGALPRGFGLQVERPPRR